MSEWAIGDGDSKERTAYEYRELYLDQGLEFKPFRCPFCEIPLTPINLYKAEELARCPHFRADKEPHRFRCDGSPKFKNAKEKKPVKRHVEKREFQLPEALVPRREPTITRPKHTRKKAPDMLDEHEVDLRRKAAVNHLGPAIYRTSLIRSVAVAFLGVFKESYEQQRKHHWGDDQRKKWVTTLLKESRLTLYDGYTLTYQNAIRNTRFPPPPKPRIFHGHATVTCTTQAHACKEYLLIPDILIENTQDDEMLHYPVEIAIRITHAEEPTGSQRHTLDRLNHVVSEGGKARWFAYGAMYLHDDGVYRMCVNSIDHVYIHSLSKPIDRP